MFLFSFFTVGTNKGKDARRRERHHTSKFEKGRTVGIQEVGMSC